MGKGRAPCCDKSKVKRGPWSAAEDSQLISFIQKHGHENWRALPKQAGLLRCGKSCRLRWMNYLRPDVKRGNFTAEEEDTIISLRHTLGNKWSKIAASLPGRTDNEIKNVWNTRLKKRVACGSRGGDVHGKLHQQSNEQSPLSSSSSSMGKRRYAPKKPRQTHQSSPSSSNIASNSTQADASAGLEDQMGSSTLELGSVGMNNLEEVNRPETTTTSVSDPFEYDFDFWSTLGNFGTIQSNETDARQISKTSFGAATVDRGREAGDSRKWFQELETEFGFPEPTCNNSNN